MDNVEIRAVRASDYLDIYELFQCPGVVRDTLQLPYVSLDDRKLWLDNLAPSEHMLVAVLDSKVIGNIELTRRRNRTAHVGQIGIAVHDDHQGKGIGTLLMGAAIDMAENWLDIKRLELHVFVDNERAIRLYKNFAFDTEGMHRKFAFRDGEYVDVYTMARVLD